LPSEGTLDATGERLLALLRANARRPAASLARALGISRSAVQERMARMEDAGLIAGYTLREGSARRGEGHAALVSVTIAVRPCSPVLERLREHPAVERAFSVGGEIDAVLVVRAASGAAMSATVDELSAIAGVVNVTTRTVLREL
jgi:DNA-binding Lrp family transcriptional regulator